DQDEYKTNCALFTVTKLEEKLKDKAIFKSHRKSVITLLALKKLVDVGATAVKKEQEPNDEIEKEIWNAEKREAGAGTNEFSKRFNILWNKLDKVCPQLRDSPEVNQTSQVTNTSKMDMTLTTTN
ncbi:unnamed protein product, partial [Didymodactylos carnosus]